MKKRKGRRHGACGGGKGQEGKVVVGGRIAGRQGCEHQKCCTRK